MYRGGELPHCWAAQDMEGGGSFWGGLTARGCPIEGGRVGSLSLLGKLPLRGAA